MTCGEKGFKTVHGLPCGQTIAPNAKACIWHGRTPEERSLLAAKAGIASKMRKALPADYKLPALDSLESYEEGARLLYRLSLTADVDRWRLGEARGALALLMQAEQIRANLQLSEAIVALQRGGPAVVLLNQYVGGQPSGRRRPLPGLTRAIQMPAEDAS